jgi:hypothetical protein
MERLVKDRTASKNKQALKNHQKHSLMAMREIEDMIAYISKKKLDDLDNKLVEIIKDHFDDQNKII